jgi:hypothetical protein
MFSLKVSQLTPSIHVPSDSATPPGAVPTHVKAVMLVGLSVPSEGAEATAGMIGAKNIPPTNAVTKTLRRSNGPLVHNPLALLRVTLVTVMFFMF